MLSNLKASAISLDAISRLDEALSHLHYRANDDGGARCAHSSAHSALPTPPSPPKCSTCTTPTLPQPSPLAASSSPSAPPATSTTSSPSSSSPLSGHSPRQLSQLRRAPPFETPLRAWPGWRSASGRPEGWCAGTSIGSVARRTMPFIPPGFWSTSPALQGGRWAAGRGLDTWRPTRWRWHWSITRDWRSWETPVSWSASSP
mmetsp:Transcript_11554/g.24365  ORF Transcript_11554/g.24365 Transcript_11554/m.24365 type:complete len:202 (+) Transcript_11554:143-748(+)